ncbi:CDP-diacylglycerol--glycerol-3-phosphate 3-phosphatidyltransferase [Candidatus Magnetomorum sp. HK-1]|nr:CDP-diacylglycerol--glycerol-3-phosphate 3-phosphatidyltransferase [Candidatus Magnetomorum sp. HK-1]
MMSIQQIMTLMRHPNALTVYRIIATPGIVVLLMFPGKGTTFFAALLFIAAAVTDFLDGFLARKRGLVSDLGKVLDPLADKVLVCSSLIMLSHLNWIPGWLVCIIIAREMAVTGLRGISAEKIDVSATRLGKFKTGFQIAAIIPLLFHYPYFGINFHAIGMLLLWIALIFTLWSGVDYFKKFFKAIL